MKLIVGSVNTAPDGWNFVSTLDQAKQHLLNETIDELHIEDVIGDDPEGGLRLIAWIKDQIKSNGYTPPLKITPRSEDNDRLIIMREKTDHIHHLVNNRTLLSSEEPLWVYLDDLRTPPRGWVLTETPEETIELLKTGRVEKLSLDNDLGLGHDERGRERDGYSVLRWLEEEVEFSGFISPNVITVHSGNPVARNRMQTVINRLEKSKKNDYEAPIYYRH